MATTRNQIPRGWGFDSSHLCLHLGIEKTRKIKGWKNHLAGEDDSKQVSNMFSFAKNFYTLLWVLRFFFFLLNLWVKCEFVALRIEWVLYCYGLIGRALRVMKIKLWWRFIKWWMMELMSFQMMNDLEILSLWWSMIECDWVFVQVMNDWEVLSFYADDEWFMDDW